MMETGGIVVAVIAMAMVLLINWRAMQSHNISWPARFRMLLIWGVIIVGLVLVIQVFQG
jgi:hypothetical protein